MLYIWHIIPSSVPNQSSKAVIFVLPWCQKLIDSITLFLMEYSHNLSPFLFPYISFAYYLQVRKGAAKKVMGVLDIYGFEIFKVWWCLFSTSNLMELSTLSLIIYPNGHFLQVILLIHLYSVLCQRKITFYHLWS